MKEVGSEALPATGEYDGSGNLVEETVWLEDLPVATLRPTAMGNPTPVTVYYVHADHLGSPRAVTRPSDNTFVWRWDNVDPFGANAATENPNGLGAFSYNLRFPGQYYDAETGTHYNYFRDYDPTVGRYLASDPILQPTAIMSVPSSMSMAIVLRWPSVLASYDYGFSSPLLFADDHGLFSVIDFIKCLYYGNKLKDFRAECERDCPADNEGYIEWVQQYGGAGYDDAVRACMCKKAGPELCRKFIESCIKTPYSGKPPTMPWPRLPE